MLRHLVADMYGFAEGCRSALHAGRGLYGLSSVLQQKKSGSLSPPHKVCHVL